MAQGFASASRALNYTTTPDVLPAEPWVRPADWLSLGAPQTSTVQLKILVAVFPGDASYVSFVISGAYTVDWGDGTSANFAAGAQASKQYLWSSIDAGTLTTRGYRQAIITITPQAGNTLTLLTLNARHAVYVTGGVQNPASPYLDIEGYLPNATSCIVGLASTGGALPRMLERFNLAGTTSITSCSQMFGNATRLRSVNLDTSLATDLNSMFFACSSLTEGPVLNTSAATSLNNMFVSCISLRSVPLYNTANVTNFGSTFENCTALREVPLFNTGACTTMQQMFRLCVNLRTVPLFNTANVTNFMRMFESCSNLRSVPAFNTSNATVMNIMFSQCTSLREMPPFDTSKVTTINAMFNACSSLAVTVTYDLAMCIDATSAFSGCASLTTGPTLLNAGSVTSWSGTFASCTALASVPNYTTTNATNMASMFNGCASLQTAPSFSSTANVTTTNAMFQNCACIQTTPTYNTANVTDARAMFNGCANLTVVPALNFAAVISGNFLNTFAGCGNLRSILATGMRFAISVLNCNLGAAALDALYTGLGTASGAQAITVTGNPGISGDTPTIATAKGWTVTGS